MNRRRSTPRTHCLVLLSSGLIGVGVPGTVSAAPAEAIEPSAPATGPETVVPAPDVPPPAADVSGPAAPSEGSPDAAEAAAPGGAGDAPGAGAVPEAPAEAAPVAEPVAEPTEAPVVAPVATADDPGAIDPTMLDGGDADPVVGPQPASRSVEYDTTDPEQAAAKLRSYYDNYFRGEEMRARLNVVAHLQFANVGSARTPQVGGRMGGASVDVGAAWNHFAVAGTLSGWGGAVYLPEETGAEMNTMFGGGPTLGYGRSALLGKGFFDLRVGYHLYYGVVNARRNGGTLVASQSDNAVLLAQTENITPHGPRVRADLGLISQARRKRFHAFGLTMGYQGLVHSLRGDLPRTHMLTLGLSYWLG